MPDVGPGELQQHLRAVIRYASLLNDVQTDYLRRLHVTFNPADNEKPHQQYLRDILRDVHYVPAAGSERDTADALLDVMTNLTVAASASQSARLRGRELAGSGGGGGGARSRFARQKAAATPSPSTTPLTAAGNSAPKAKQSRNKGAAGGEE